MFKKKTIIGIFLVALLLTFGTTQATAADSIFDRANQPLNTAIDQAYGGGQDVQTDESSFVGGLIIVINYVLSFLGILFFGLLFYGGYLWMTAQGNNDKLEKAKKITREVVIGLIIIIMARVIAEFTLIQLGLITQ